MIGRCRMCSRTNRTLTRRHFCVDRKECEDYFWKVEKGWAKKRSPRGMCMGAIMVPLPEKRRTFKCHGCGRHKDISELHHRRDERPYCVSCWKRMY